MKTLGIWAGLAGPPLAWAAQMMASESMASHACYPNNQPLAAPLFNQLPLIVGTVDLICLLAGVACSWITLSEWRNLSRTAGHSGKRIIETGETRQGFLVMLSALSCFVFVVAILFTSFAVVLVSPCHPW